MPLHPSFKEHGTFVFNAKSTMDRHGGRSGIVREFKAMGITHAWVRLFGVAGAVVQEPTAGLVGALRNGGIEVAGWGYCHGADWELDLSRSIDLSEQHGLKAFVADVEPGNSTSMGRTTWSRSDFRKYMRGIKDHFGKENIGVSTWPVPKIQDAHDAVELIKIAAPHAGMFAPQAYWMTFPKQIHYNVTGFRESKYPRASPEAFVRLVIDAWRQMEIENPLVITGQLYWGEGGPDQDVMEGKLTTFTDSFEAFDRIVGFNWWHAGGENQQAMSNDMVATLKAAKLNEKEYAQA